MADLVFVSLAPFLSNTKTIKLVSATFSFNFKRDRNSAIDLKDNRMCYDKLNLKRTKTVGVTFTGPLFLLVNARYEIAGKIDHHDK